MTMPAAASLLSILSFALRPRTHLASCAGWPIRGISPTIRRPRIRPAGLLIATVLAMVAGLSAVSHAQARDKIIINATGCQVTEENAYSNGIFYNTDLYLRIDFPNSHWRFGLRDQGLKGLSMVDVSLQAAQFTTKQYMIKHAGLADIFVPYDDGTFKAYDMSSLHEQDPMDPADLPSQNGALVYLRTPSGNNYLRDPFPKVAVECRDAGIAWLCKQPGNHIRRRAQEVVVWGVYDGQNYDNIIEYTFREDGSIGFRYGATGYNLPSKPNAPHVHNGLWRVSTQLFGRTDNQVLEFEHTENADGTIATDSENPITNETALTWEPLKFSSVVVQSTSQMNDYGDLMGYEFLPQDRTGTGRFSQRPQDKELWTQNDYYLTNDNPGEDGSGQGHNNWRYTWYSPDDYLLTYLNNEVLGGTGNGIVLWTISSSHHEPSDLDNQQGQGGRTGVTLVHWNGMEMEPHNLFDYNPLGGPARCGN
jgi:hypothetical protein